MGTAAKRGGKRRLACGHHVRNQADKSWKWSSTVLERRGSGTTVTVGPSQFSGIQQISDVSQSIGSIKIASSAALPITECLPSARKLRPDCISTTSLTLPQHAFNRTGGMAQRFSAKSPRNVSPPMPPSGCNGPIAQRSCGTRAPSVGMPSHRQRASNERLTASCKLPNSNKPTRKADVDNATKPTSKTLATTSLCSASPCNTKATQHQGVFVKKFSTDIVAPDRLS